MDKNTITGFVLIGIILFGFQWWSQPSKEEVAEMQRQDSIAQVEQMQQEKIAKEQAEQKKIDEETAAQDSSALFFENRSSGGSKVVLKNNLVKLTLNTKGAHIEEAELLNYKNWKGDPLKLLGTDIPSFDMQWETKEETLTALDMNLSVVEQSDSSAVLRMGNEQKHIDVCYTLHPNSYMTDITISSKGMAGLFSPRTETMYIGYNAFAKQLEKGAKFENRYCELKYMETDGDLEHLSANGDDDEKPEEALTWVSFKNQFFSSVLVSADGFTDAKLESHSSIQVEGALKAFSARMSTKFDPTGKQPTRLQIYTGPNDFHVLQAHNDYSITGKSLKLESTVDFGWILFRWINRWFILYLFDWLTAFGLPMGIVLLLLTIIVKALVYPATKKSYLSSARMRVLKPKIDELSKKYPKQEDALKKQQEMMQIYSQYGVSPMGGCLPMLIQMPIWIALFNFVPNAIELRGESFLWANDLSAYDDLIHWNKEIWLIGDHISIFCLLFSVTNIFNSMISMRQQQNSMMSAEQAQQMKMMQYMMYVMPLMFFFMFNDYSSGLCYYYFLSGLTSILIMWALRKFTDDDKLLAQLEAYKAKHANDPKKTSSLAARLEAMQKMAEEQQRNRQ